MCTASDVNFGVGRQLSDRFFLFYWPYWLFLDVDDVILRHCDNLIFNKFATSLLNVWRSIQQRVIDVSTCSNTMRARLEPRSMCAR